MTLSVKTFDELTTTELYEIIKSRIGVFIVEQSIICQDLDDVDKESLHCFYMENGSVIAYLRAFYNDESHTSVRISRVLTLEHGKGTGRKLLDESLDAIKSRFDCKKIICHAQKHAIGFYEKFGFVVTSDEYLEEGIIHVNMELDI